MRFLREIFFITIFFCCNIFCNDENRQTVESIDGRDVDWLTFLRNYVAKEKPVILRKAFRHTSAYKAWSPDFIKYNRGFEFFYYGSVTEPVSIRKILNYHDIYLRFTAELPWIMRKDIMLPKMLDCDLLVKNMNTPRFRWEFHDWVQPIHGNYDSQDELLCSVLNSKKITLISDWTSGMLDHTIEDILKNEPDVENSLYEFELRAGDCAFLPSNMLRQVVHKSDGIGIVFQIDHKLTNITQYPYKTCKSLGESKSLQKIHFGLEQDTTDLTYWNIVEVFLRKLSAYPVNPYEFTLNKATSVQLECNGTLYPSQPYTPKLSWLEPYINSLKIVNKLYADTNTGLEIDDYLPNGHQALVFDLSVTESGNADYKSPKQNGIHSISASWEPNDILSNYTLIFYQQWDSEIAIDSRKNIILNYIP